MEPSFQTMPRGGSSNVAASNMGVPENVVSRNEVEPQNVARSKLVGLENVAPSNEVGPQSPDGDQVIVLMSLGGPQEARSLKAHATAGGDSAALLVTALTMIASIAIVWPVAGPLAAITSDAALALLYALHRLLSRRRQ